MKRKLKGWIFACLCLTLGLTLVYYAYSDSVVQTTPEGPNYLELPFTLSPPSEDGIEDIPLYSTQNDADPFSSSYPEDNGLHFKTSRHTKKLDSSKENYTVTYTGSPYDPNTGLSYTISQERTFSSPLN